MMGKENLLRKYVFSNLKFVILYQKIKVKVSSCFNFYNWHKKCIMIIIGKGNIYINDHFTLKITNFEELTENIFQKNYSYF